MPPPPPPSPARRRRRLAGAVFAKELRETLRDRRVILGVIVSPLLLIPLLAAAAGYFAGVKTAERRSEILAVALVGGDALPDGRMDYTNRRWVEYTGLSAEQSRGWAWKEALHPDDFVTFFDRWTTSIDRATPYDAEIRLRASDGSYRWLLARAELVFDREQRPVGWFGTCTDIDERFVHRALSGHFRKALMEMAIPAVLHAEDDEILLVNRAWTELTGYSHGDIPTMEAWAARAYGQRSTAAQRHVEKLFEAEARVDEGEWPIRTRDGERRIWHFYSAPVGCDDHGRRLVLSTAVDVIEERQTREALNDSEERFRTLADNNSQLAWISLALEPGRPSAGGHEVVRHRDRRPRTERGRRRAPTS